MSELSENYDRITNYTNSDKIHSRINYQKQLDKKVFSDKFRLINNLIDSLATLTDLYLKCIFMKQQLSLRYDDNVVMDNALLNQITLNYSIIFLLENTFYGSARVLLRQFFEFLIIGKFSEYDDGRIVKKWGSKSTNSRENIINFSNDVLHKLDSKDVSAIKEMWQELSNVSHPTRYAQQIPYFLSSDLHQESLDKNYRNMHYTLDLFFMLLCMNYHLLINWGRKTRGWYLGYHKDPMNNWKLENEIKEKIKPAIREYFNINNKHKGVNSKLKKVIFQYRQNWSVAK